LDAARIRLCQADRHVEGGGLSRAVRPKQADDLRRGDVEADALDHRAPAIGFREVVRPEGRHQGHFPPPLVCVRICWLPSMTMLSLALTKVRVLPVVSRSH